MIALVAITPKLELGATEVTVEQWRDTMGTLPDRYRFLDDDAIPWDKPVVHISWYDAVAFTNELSALEGYTPCYRVEGRDVLRVDGCDGYRLPTAREWESALGTALFDDDTDPAGVCAFANVDSKGDHANPWRRPLPCSDGYARLAPVATFAPNASGLYDMTGNATEWVFDGTRRGRQVRGGSWFHGLRFAKNASRSARHPVDTHADVGFRLARDRSEPPGS